MKTLFVYFKLPNPLANLTNPNKYLLSFPITKSRTTSYHNFFKNQQSFVRDEVLLIISLKDRFGFKILRI